MKSMRTLMFAGLAAAGLALAGCGSDGGPSQADLDAANDATAAQEQLVAELRAQIAELAEEAGVDDPADVGDSIDALRAQIADLQKQIKDAADAVADAAEKARLAEMAATAAKLYAGIAAQNGATTTTTVAAGTALADGQRAAAYNDANVGGGTTADTRIVVGIGIAAVVGLSEDKKTMVAANHGWEGKMYSASPTGGGTYEAVVYSNVGDSTPGAMFDTEYTDNFADGVLDETTTEGTSSRVASPSFDQSAGVKEFELPTNNVAVMIAGSYHGVSGTYSCVPAASSTCAAQVAASGFNLGGTADADNAFSAAGGTWTFKPSNPKARVMSTPDTIYASYGWWINKSADGKTFTASAFVDDKGEVTDAAGLDTLQGTATYMGGAAGKYALSSSTGGTNDAGHFTARATLEADFSDNSITGTIDNFMGSDGAARDWSVELKEAAVAATGAITRTGTDEDGNDTVWTIDGTAAAASGEWSGSLQDNGTDGVPKVGTGTFYSTYGQDGKMVGAFGVNKQ